jgi:hypothetical protein
MGERRLILLSKRNNPAQIFKEYRDGTQFKSGLGMRGLYEQSKMNERYFIGDQWYGVNCGNDRPLIRHNVIKRIGEYKMSVVGSSPITVSYTADGIPNTLGLKEAIRPIRDGIAQGNEAYIEQMMAMSADTIPSNEEVTLIMSALSDYFRVTAERVKFNDKCEQALRNAFISGTGIIYTYWDDKVKTGLYADENRTTPIVGDIGCEVLDVENVYFGDPNLTDIQSQPYILVAQRKSVAELKREAKHNRRPQYEIDQIKPDNETGYEAGQISENEPSESKKATVITKFWKEWDDDGSDYTLKAIKVCENAVIRPEWDVGIRLYPFASFLWERRRNCAYGESEITYLIPNQIAINRMMTASVWAVMMMGMPMLVVNSDVVDAGSLTNDPGQIISVNGGYEDVHGAMSYLNPPNFSPSFIQNVNTIIGNTLQQSGANDAALGDMRPENTSAIAMLREAATMPLQQTKNRYYSFIEDIARIWAEFWIMKYGKRSIKVEDDTGTWYLPFDGERYRDLLISTRIDVGASGLWSEAQSTITLGNLLDRQIITPIQYLQRLPKGIIPQLEKLIRELQTAAGGEMDGGAIDIETLISALPPDLQDTYNNLDPETAQAVVQQAVMP